MQFDAHQIQAALREHYRAKLGATPFRVSDIGYIGEGIGNYMFAFRLVVAEGGSQTEQQLILRLGQNAEARLREFQALERLQATPVPVPAVHDVGDEMLGHSFMIMQRVVGANMDKVMRRMDDAQRAQVRSRFVRILAEIHRVDWQGEGFDAFLVRPDGPHGYVDRFLSRLREWCSWPNAFDLRPVLDWLEANKPPCDRYVLLHGDYLPGNLLLMDGEIAAVVDWDAVGIGDPAYDVCWPLLATRLFGPNRGWGNEPEERYLAAYCADAAVPEVANLAYYQVVRASLLLYYTSMLKTHGAEKLGARQKTEMLAKSPELDFAGRCARFVAEETGVVVSTG